MATTGMCAVAGSSRRIFRASIAADAGQIDVHQDHIGPVDARAISMPQIPVHRAQQANIGAARDESARPASDSPDCPRHRAGCAAARRAAHALGRLPRLRLLPAASCGSAAEFSSNQNTLPTPTVLSTPMTPPISSTSRLLTTRPMPVPSSPLASCPRRLNGWKSCASCSGASPAPVSLTLMRMRSGVLTVHSTSTVPSALVVFDRVGKQVDENLLHPGPIGMDKVRACRTGERSCGCRAVAPAVRSWPGIRA